MAVPQLFDLTTVVHTLVTICLDYYNTLYVEQPLKIVHKLQLMRKVAKSSIMLEGGEGVAQIRSTFWSLIECSAALLLQDCSDQKFH